ncbi:hypothetical protein LEP1GSC199_2162 [Leptospira vanthielii serovar Holland str. Waz Holland = ATCC 700522]|uniref:Uncharacterized protein n=1 Tax=Leptospira vanthielii serovar Holland str. Waz Holland = ATCC 700522 TaxID=1218591 RepID=N1WCU7_9LEPT|nr:hypothetical protein LEP1GSC199_2162 [Leptospira vanthielii serovar Holland str. Waz Holland = ATCC 700522]
MISSQSIAVYPNDGYRRKKAKARKKTKTKQLRKGNEENKEEFNIFFMMYSELKNNAC